MGEAINNIHTPFPHKKMETMTSKKDKKRDQTGGFRDLFARVYSLKYGRNQTPINVVRSSYKHQAPASFFSFP